MRKFLRSPKAFLLQAMLGAALAVVATAVLSVNSLAMSVETAKAKRPADAESGLGPRVSAQDQYVATLEPLGLQASELRQLEAFLKSPSARSRVSAGAGR